MKKIITRIILILTFIVVFLLRGTTQGGTMRCMN